MYFGWTILSGICYVISTITVIVGICEFGTFKGLFISIPLIILGYLCNLIYKYKCYYNEEEYYHHQRIPVVTMTFKELINYYNLFPEDFMYDTFDDKFYFHESERNVKKMFYFNRINSSYNKINFFFKDWLKFYFWNKKRIRLEKKKAYEEAYNKEKETAEQLAKKNFETDKRATELMYQDLLNRVENELKQAQNEIKQGTEGMKEVINGWYCG